jgi:hypothetical protein
MENFTAWTATPTDRGLTAVHGGTALLASPRPGSRTSAATCAADAKRIDRVRVMSTFGAGSNVPAYVVDQESHPPRERSAD